MPIEADNPLARDCAMLGLVLEAHLQLLKANEAERTRGPVAHDDGDRHACRSEVEAVPDEVPDPWAEELCDPALEIRARAPHHALVTEVGHDAAWTGTKRMTRSA